MLAARIAAGRRYRLGVDFAEIDALRAQSFNTFTLVEREIYSTSKLLVHTCTHDVQFVFSFLRGGARGI